MESSSQNQHESDDESLFQLGLLESIQNQEHEVYLQIVHGLEHMWLPEAEPEQGHQNQIQQGFQILRPGQAMYNQPEPNNPNLITQGYPFSWLDQAMHYQLEHSYPYLFPQGYQTSWPGLAMQNQPEQSYPYLFPQRYQTLWPRLAMQNQPEQSYPNQILQGYPTLWQSPAMQNQAEQRYPYLFPQGYQTSWSGLAMQNQPEQSYPNRNLQGYPTLWQSPAMQNQTERRCPYLFPQGYQTSWPGLAMQNQPEQSYSNQFLQGFPTLRPSLAMLNQPEHRYPYLFSQGYPTSWPGLAMQNQPEQSYPNWFSRGYQILRLLQGLRSPQEEGDSSQMYQGNPIQPPGESRQSQQEQEHPRQLGMLQKLSLILDPQEPGNPRHIRQGDRIPWPDEAGQSQQERDNMKRILQGLRILWQWRYYLGTPANSIPYISQLNAIIRDIFSTWPVTPLQHIPERVIIRHLGTNRHEPIHVPKLSQMALQSFSTINPLNSIYPLKVMSMNRQQIDYFCNVPEHNFKDIQGHINLFELYYLCINAPDTWQFEAHFLKLPNLTIYLYTDEMPRDWNEAHLFMTEDLKNYDRDHGKHHEYIDVKYMDEAMTVFKDLGNLCRNIKALTVIFDDSKQQLNPNVLSQLFAEMPLVGLEQFSFIRSTQFDDVIQRTELERVGLLYRLFQDNLTKEKMPLLRKLTIWLSHEEARDMELDQRHPNYFIVLNSIVPQLERLTFVGPCANKRLFLAQLERATRLTHLTLDFSRIFDPIDPIEEGWATSATMKRTFKEYFPECVLKKVTHLRLYRVNLRTQAQNPTELIKLMPNLESLQVHTAPINKAQTDDLQFFQAVSRSRLTELRLHNFEFNGNSDSTAGYPSVTKLTLCDVDLSLRQLFLGQVRNLRELVIFTKSRNRYVNQRFFDTIKQTCRFLESVHSCDSELDELGDDTIMFDLNDPDF